MTWVQPPAPCPAHEQHPGEVSSPLCRGWGSIFKITPPAPLSVVLALVCDVADVPDLVPHTWAISALGTPPPVPPVTESPRADPPLTEFQSQGRVKSCHGVRLALRNFLNYSENAEPCSVWRVITVCRGTHMDWTGRTPSQGSETSLRHCPSEMQFSAIAIKAAPMSQHATVLVGSILFHLFVPLRI